MNGTRMRLIAFLIGAVLLVVLSGAGGYWLARSHERASAAGARVSVAGTPPAAAASARKPLYWYDPMAPDQHFDKPGKSPYMDMDLIPKYADEGSSAEGGSIRIDPTVVQNLGVRTTEVRRGALSEPIEAVGTLVFNERDVAIIQARSTGFITKVYARAPGDVLSRGASIVDLLVPEWAGAQTEYLALLESGEQDLMEAARQRMLLLGMPSELVAEVAATRKVRTTVTVRTPIAGVIDTLEARQGMTVAMGTTLARINGLATVWLEAAVPEAQGALARVGRTAQARLTAYPDQTFSGRVVAVLPQANVETRTVRVRIQLDNRDGQLRPGLFARVRLESGDDNPVLYVPSEAVIRTGKRVIVIVAAEGGRFIPTEVRTGADVSGQTVVLDGLAEHQRVVVSGQFLIDSEASLRGALSRLAVQRERAP